MDGFFGDLPFALRQIRRHPGFTLVAVLTLGLGIGTNSTLFALVNLFILHPLPIPEDHELTAVWDVQPGKRLRPFLHCRPRTASAVLHILLRALRATLTEACPTAPRTASFGAVSFLHRFGSSLNPRFHYHLCVVDGRSDQILYLLRGPDPGQLSDRSLTVG